MAAPMPLPPPVTAAWLRLNGRESTICTAAPSTQLFQV
jgi:hypothetical protein